MHDELASGDRYMKMKYHAKQKGSYRSSVIVRSIYPITKFGGNAAVVCSFVQRILTVSKFHFSYFLLDKQETDYFSHQ